MSKFKLPMKNSKGISPVATNTTQKNVKINERIIKSVELIESESSGFDLTQKSQLASGFVAFRKILQGPGNLPLAVGVRVLDYCISNSKKELFYELYSLLHTYHFHFLENSKGVLEFMYQVNGILYSNIEAKLKLQEIEKLYESDSKVLEMTIRNLVYIATKLNYYRKSCTEGLDLRPINELSQIIQSDCLESTDFILFLNNFDIQLKIANFLTNQFITCGTKSTNIIYLLKIQNGEFNTLYTAEEYFKLSATDQECSDLKIVLSKIKQNESEIPAEEIKQIKDKTQEFQKKTQEIFDVLRIFDSSINLQSGLHSLNAVVDNSDTIPVLEKFCCNKCLKLQKSAEFPCGHALCYSCSYLNYDHDFRFCSICNFKAYKDAIDKYFN